MPGGTEPAFKAVLHLCASLLFVTYAHVRICAAAATEVNLLISRREHPAEIDIDLTEGVESVQQQRIHSRHKDVIGWRRVTKRPRLPRGLHRPWAPFPLWYQSGPYQMTLSSARATGHFPSGVIDSNDGTSMSGGYTTCGGQRGLPRGGFFFSSVDHCSLMLSKSGSATRTPSKFV